MSLTIALADHSVYYLECFWAAVAGRCTQRKPGSLPELRRQSREFVEAKAMRILRTRTKEEAATQRVSEMCRGFHVRFQLSTGNCWCGRKLPKAGKVPPKAAGRKIPEPLPGLGVFKLSVARMEKYYGTLGIGLNTQKGILLQ